MANEKTNSLINPIGWLHVCGQRGCVNKVTHYTHMGAGNSRYDSRIGGIIPLCEEHMEQYRLLIRENMGIRVLADGTEEWIPPGEVAGEVAKAGGNGG